MMKVKALLAPLTSLRLLPEQHHPHKESLAVALMTAHQQLAPPPVQTTTLAPSPNCWIRASTPRTLAVENIEENTQAPVSPQEMTTDTVTAGHEECSSEDARKPPMTC